MMRERRAAPSTSRLPAQRPIRLRFVLALLVASALSTGACDASTESAAGPPEPAATAEAAADAAGHATLARIVDAEKSLAYHGFRSITQGPRGSSRETRLQVVHTADDRTLLTCAGDAAAQAPRWRSTARFPWLERPELLLANYSVTLDPRPSEPVAWRETRRVHVRGRHPARPSVELLVDAETWLVLAESALDASGAEWRHAEFESVEYGDPPGGAVTADSADCEPGLAAGDPPDEWTPLTPSSVPEGFERIAVGRSPCGSWREDWTDGLAVFSVLQARRSPSDAAVERRAEGDVTRRRWRGGSALITTRDGVEITVFGTLGSDELLRVVRGLHAPSVSR